MTTTTNISIPSVKSPGGLTQKPWLNEALKETANLGVAEMASAAVSVGVFAYLDDLAPNMVKSVSSALGKTILPYIDPIEKVLNKCKLEECRPDFSKSKEERAEQYAHYLFLFGASLLPALVTEVGVRMGMNRLTNVKGAHANGATTLWDHLKPSKHDMRVVAVDKSIQLGGIVAINTIFANQADQMIKSISGFLQKSLGMSEAQATRAADAFVIWHLADGLGFGGAAADIFRHHHKQR